MSASAFNDELARRAAQIQAALETVFREWGSDRGDAVGKLIEAIAYSALGPGKRVRPALSLWAAESFDVPAGTAMPWAAAVEMVHTYSLIHDDLPCMDDDDERRGRPTNHVVYGQATALLAGDALLTEAFGHLASSYPGETCAGLVGLLARAAGVRGMIGGQALDMAASGAEVSLTDLERLHRMKTGALIAVAVEGAAVIAGAPAPSREAARRFGEGLGLAFQIADDLIDSEQERQDGRSYVRHLGTEATRKALADVSDEASRALRSFPSPSPWLVAAVDWNRTRTK